MKKWIIFTLIASLLSLSSCTKKEQAKLLIATNAEYPPYSFIDHDALVGFDIDLCQEIGKRLHQEIVIKNLSFDALIPELILGRVHLAAAGLTPNKKRSERVYFSNTYFSGDNFAIVTLKNNPLLTLDELKNKKVTVNEGYTADLFLSEYEGLEILRLPAPIDSFLALLGGKVDAFFATRCTIEPFINKNKSDFSVAVQEASDGYSLAISHKYPDLLPKINAILDELEKEGVLGNLKAKWNLQ